MAYCCVLLCNINKKSSCQDGEFLSMSNKHLDIFHFPLAIYRKSLYFHILPLRNCFAILKDFALWLPSTLQRFSYIQKNRPDQSGLSYKYKCGRRDLNPHSEIRTRT